MKNNHTELDGHILKAVGKGKNRFMKIQAGIPRSADVLWNDRLIDRRLQTLRKKGKLVYAAKTGWTIPAKETKPATRVVTEGML